MAKYAEAEIPRDSQKPLSPREQQVVGFVLKAWTNLMIANELHLTEGTVKVYMRHILAKLGVKRRSEIMLLALNGKL